MSLDLHRSCVVCDSMAIDSIVRLIMIYILIFLTKMFVLSMIICIFAAREPAKPLNDAQMCGSFLFL